MRTRLPPARRTVAGIFIVLCVLGLKAGLVLVIDCAESVADVVLDRAESSGRRSSSTISTMSASRSRSAAGPLWKSSKRKPLELRTEAEQNAALISLSPKAAVRPTDVVDLMQRLKDSLAQSGHNRPAGSRAMSVTRTPQKATKKTHARRQ